MYFQSFFPALMVLGHFLQKYLSVYLSFTFPNNLETNLTQELLGVSSLDILPIKRDISTTIHPQKGHITPWMLPSLRVNHISYTLIFRGRLEEWKISCQEFFLLGMVRLVGVPQPVNVPNVSTSNTSSSPTVQDVSGPKFSYFASILPIVQNVSTSEFSDSAPTLPIVPNVPALDSSNESASEHKKFQQTPNEELIVENLPTEIPANEDSAQR